MTRRHLFLDLDASNDLCLWSATGPDDEYPKCVARQCDVDPVVWTLIFSSLLVDISRLRAGVGS